MTWGLIRAEIRGLCLSPSRSADEGSCNGKMSGEGGKHCSVTGGWPLIVLSVLYSAPTMWYAEYTVLTVVGAAATDIELLLYCTVQLLFSFNTLGLPRDYYWLRGKFGSKRNPKRAAKLRIEGAVPILPTALLYSQLYLAQIKFSSCNKVGQVRSTRMCRHWRASFCDE